MNTLLMRDSTTASNIPEDTPVVAGYTNGRYKWKDSDWARFPNSKLVRICIFIPGRTTPLDEGDDVLDTEARDVRSDECQHAIDLWVPFQQSKGKVPCIYTSKSFLPDVYRDGCDFFLADYPEPGQPYTPHLLPGTVATQYAGDDNFGGLYDESLVVDYWPKPKDGKQMPTALCVGIKVTPSGKGYWLFGADGGVFSYGDAVFYGSLGGVALNKPITGVDVMPDGKGYVMVGGDYGFFPFGSAVEAFKDVDPSHP